MVHFMRIVLAMSIVVFAVNNVIVDAGEGTKNRKKNLTTRASKHEDTLKSHEDQFKSKYSEMSESDIKELTDLNNVIIDHIVGHEEFKSYLKNIFVALQEYADGQIKSRNSSLEKIYKEWEKNNFPDKEMKDRVKNTLIKEGQIVAGEKNKIEKKSTSKKGGSKKKNKKN